jgi:hypothetical protein
MRCSICLLVLAFCLNASAAERRFQFHDYSPGQSPTGFRSTVAGQGDPGVWKIVEDEVPSSFQNVTGQGAASSRKSVLAQLSEDLTDEHFPMLIFDEEAFADFTLTTRFKIVRGIAEQMAGVAFRIQDERNYYYIRASALGNTFRFFKVVNGVRSAPIGPDIQIERGVWHEMTIECKGNRIRALLNGVEVIPTLTDNSFGAGKVGFWTKSDSIAYFGETKLVYTPLEKLSQVIVREMIQKYPRLVGLRIYTTPPDQEDCRLVASDNSREVGRLAGTTERDVIARGSIYYGRRGADVIVTMPLRDRNGDHIAAAQVLMKSFKGQTEQNALARALPIVREMEGRIRSSTEVFE